MTQRVAALFAIASTVAGLSCAATTPQLKEGAIGGIVVLPVRPSVFVRATFDSDASWLIGSFFPDDVEDGALDETRAARTRCSEFIKPRKVAASGEVEDVFGASSAVGGKIGVPGIAKIAGERSQSNALRIKYSAAEKLVADVDTRGLAECCAAAPDQCSNRYIASAISGDGRIYVATAQENKVGAEADGTSQGAPVGGDFMFKDGLKWERTTDFKGQFFAFSFQQTGTGKAAADVTGDAKCGWARKVPKSLDGAYFVGVSDPMPSERVARDQAMKEARSQVVKYLGEYIAQSTQTNQKVSGEIGAIGAALDDNTTVETLSQGLAKLVKDEAWCDAEAVETPKGTHQVVRVLAFFPNTERASASRMQLQGLIDVLKSKGQLTREREAALKAAIAEIK